MMQHDIISPWVPDIQDNDITAWGYSPIQSCEDACRCVSVDASVDDSDLMSPCSQSRLKLGRVGLACRDAMASDGAVAERNYMNFRFDDSRPERNCRHQCSTGHC